MTSVLQPAVKKRQRHGINYYQKGTYGYHLTKLESTTAILLKWVESLGKGNVVAHASSANQNGHSAILKTLREELNSVGMIRPDDVPSSLTINEAKTEEKRYKTFSSWIDCVEKAAAQYAKLNHKVLLKTSGTIKGENADPFLSFQLDFREWQSKIIDITSDYHKKCLPIFKQRVGVLFAKAKQIQKSTSEIFRLCTKERLKHQEFRRSRDYDDEQINPSNQSSPVPDSWQDTETSSDDDVVSTTNTDKDDSTKTGGIILSVSYTALEQPPRSQSPSSQGSLNRSAAATGGRELGNQSGVSSDYQNTQRSGETDPPQLLSANDVEFILKRLNTGSRELSADLSCFLRESETVDSKR